MIMKCEKKNSYSVNFIFTSPGCIHLKAYYFSLQLEDNSGSCKFTYGTITLCTVWTVKKKADNCIKSHSLNLSWFIHVKWIKCCITSIRELHRWKIEGRIDLMTFNNFFITFVGYNRICKSINSLHELFKARYVYWSMIEKLVHISVI